MRFRCIWRVLLSLVLSGPSLAHAAWTDMHAPVAALEALGIDLGDGRALAGPRAVRVLHSLPRDLSAPPAPAIVDFDALITDLTRVQEALARAGGGALSLRMAGTRTERRALEDVLEAAGLRLRTRGSTSVVELDTGRDAAATRTRLDRLGLDIAGVVSQLNAGEDVTLAPVVTDLPLPLPPAAWAVVFGRPVAEASLFGAIMTDRRAALLYHGLLSLSPRTLDAVASRPAWLRQLYDDGAPALAAFGGAFRVGDDGRVEVPGGAEVASLWEELFDAPIGDPERFSRALFSRDGGRLAYFYDGVAQLDAAHQRFALGLWIVDPARRRDRFRDLASAFVDIDPQWALSTSPFLRPTHDGAVLLRAARVESQTGRPVAPAWLWVWERGLDRDDLPAPAPGGPREVEDEGIVDAAWLAGRIKGELPSVRRERLERFAFAQRAFADTSPADAGDVLTAVRAYGRYPAAMLTLERLRVGRPAIFGHLARHARQLEAVSAPRDVAPLLAQFQGALTLLERATRAGALPLQDTAPLLSALFDVPLASEGYDGGVGRWVRDALLPAFPGGTAVPGGSQEAALLSALAARAPASPVVQWEGARYRLDVHGTAVERLAEVRRKQGGNRLDAVLTLLTLADRLRAPALQVTGVAETRDALASAVTSLREPRPWAGAGDGVPSLEAITRDGLRDLGRIRRPADLRRAREVGVRLTRVADYLLGEVLVALAYAPAVGNPDDLLGPEAELSHRHNFGLLTRAGTPASHRTAWRRPLMDAEAAVGQALTGAVLGLDLALSRRLLRRMVVERMPPPPRLNPNDREALVSTLPLLDSQRLHDEDLQWIAAALTRGRARLGAAGVDPAALDRLAATAGLGATRRTALAWVAAHAPDDVAALFSTTDVWRLGLEPGDDERRLQAWGVSQEALDGCLCIGVPARGGFEAYRGRPGTGVLGSVLVDLNLRVAEVLAGLDVPAGLFADVLPMALQDYLDGVPALFDDDWQAVARYTGFITRERVEDYVSALAAAGPLRPE